MTCNSEQTNKKPGIECEDCGKTVSKDQTYVTESKLLVCKDCAKNHSNVEELNIIISKNVNVNGIFKPTSVTYLVVGIFLLICGSGVTFLGIANSNIINWLIGAFLIIFGFFSLRSAKTISVPKEMDMEIHRDES